MLITLTESLWSPQTRLGQPAASALELLALLTFTAAAVIIAREDAASFRIPDRVLLPATMLITAGLMAASIAAGTWDAMHDAAWASLVAAGVYLALHLFSRGAIGFGDVKFAALIGLMTGWFSPQAAVLAPVLAFGGAGVGVLLLFIRHRVDRHTQIPLAPWLTFGALAALLLPL